MKLPEARGACSELMFDLLVGTPGQGSAGPLLELAEAAARADPLYDDDTQVTLTAMYELHYRGVEGVDDGWEWDVDLLRARAVLERAFEQRLREQVAGIPTDVAPEQVSDALFAMTAPDGRPGVAAYLARAAGRRPWVEFAMHRSLYQLKEADPHTWAIPRLSGRAKSALIEVQIDEYGGGRIGRMHSDLYAQLLRALNLDDADGAHVNAVPAITLAWVNAMSLFGLHRRLRGALVGHLAAYEMTSPLPCRLYANGLRRLGYGPAATEFFDEHVEADAIHEQIAGRDLAGGLALAEPELARDIMFGAAAELALDAALADHLLSSWQAGSSSLRNACL